MTMIMIMVMMMMAIMMMSMTVLMIIMIMMVMMMVEMMIMMMMMMMWLIMNTRDDHGDYYAFRQIVSLCCHQMVRKSSPIFGNQKQELMMSNNSNYDSLTRATRSLQPQI